MVEAEASDASALADAVVRWCARLATCHETGELPVGQDVSTDRAREDLLSALEVLKNSACAAQATLAVELETSVRAQDAAAEKPPASWGRDAAHRVALARGESPHRGRMLLGLAKELHDELPWALAAMRTGLLSEFRASVVDRETSCMSLENRGTADRELFAPAADGAPADALFLGTRQLGARAAGIAARLDPAGVARRRARAEGERCVSLRPAPDGMTYLTGLLPVAQGVAAHVALTRRAETAKAAGDTRSKGQLMADLMVADLTELAGAPRGRVPVGVTVDLVISDRTLFGGGSEPAFLTGRGVPGAPIDAPSARSLVADALDAYPEALAFIRKLYADQQGRLVGMSSVRRFAPRGLADFLRIRDHGVCRTPWCDAPIAEIDHVVASSDGGVTSAASNQGLCTACNEAKTAGGWRQSATAGAGMRHTVTTLTPTGRSYRTEAPSPPAPERTHPPPVA